MLFASVHKIYVLDLVWLCGEVRREKENCALVKCGAMQSFITSIQRHSLLWQECNSAGYRCCGGSAILRGTPRKLFHKSVKHVRQFTFIVTIAPGHYIFTFIGYVKQKDINDFNISASGLEISCLYLCISIVIVFNDLEYPCSMPRKAAEMPPSYSDIEKTSFCVV